MLDDSRLIFGTSVWVGADPSISRQSAHRRCRRRHHHHHHHPRLFQTVVRRTVKAEEHVKTYFKKERRKPQKIKLPHSNVCEPLNDLTRLPLEPLLFARPTVTFPTNYVNIYLP